MNDTSIAIDKLNEWTNHGRFRYWQMGYGYGLSSELYVEIGEYGADGKKNWDIVEIQGVDLTGKNPTPTIAQVVDAALAEWAASYSDVEDESNAN